MEQPDYNKEDIIRMLEAEGDEKTSFFKQSAEIKRLYVKDKVYFRGLIEFSNICAKNCFYCGIRKDNEAVARYNLTDEEIINAALFAQENKFGSLVLQSGELESKAFTKRIESLLKEIHQKTNNSLRITLSCGEQSIETYKRWFESGAHRYLLRIESSTPELYLKLHPNDDQHRFHKRVKALINLKDIGYQTGTGVMVGLPYQSIENLADDILFMKGFDIDMIGLGPYIEHTNTPLYKHKDLLLPLETRFQLTLKMIAALRIIMKDINIASATALQAIDKIGREKAIKIGANVIMPNITPGKYRDSYRLYENKPCTDDSAEDCVSCLEMRIALAENQIALDEWGDSLHFKKRTSNYFE